MATDEERVLDALYEVVAVDYLGRDEVSIGYLAEQAAVELKALRHEVNVLTARKPTITCPRCNGVGEIDPDGAQPVAESAVDPVVGT